jgi:hypothetical protein
MNYHVGRAGQQLGVFSLQDVRSKLASGEFRADDLCWTEGMSDWQPLGRLFPDASPSFTAQTPPTPPTHQEPSDAFTSASSTAGSPGYIGPKPANNLVGAILVTLFCCLPFGIPAIIYASQVDSKYQSGDQDGAQDAAAKAKKWMWIGFWAGLLPIAAWFLLLAAGFVSGFQEGWHDAP